ncbi:MAG: DUF3467 domain-containing protein [bacterium]
MEEQKIQINLDPEGKIITNTTVRFDEELFQLMIISGNQARQFYVTPQHAKRMALLLNQCVNDYEKQFGILKTDLSKTAQSETGKKKIGF